MSCVWSSLIASLIDFSIVFEVLPLSTLFWFCRSLVSEIINSVLFVISLMALVLFDISLWLLYGTLCVFKAIHPASVHMLLIAGRPPVSLLGDKLMDSSSFISWNSKFAMQASSVHSSFLFVFSVCDLVLFSFSNFVPFKAACVELFSLSSSLSACDFGNESSALGVTSSSLSSSFSWDIGFSGFGLTRHEEAVHAFPSCWLSCFLSSSIALASSFFTGTLSSLFSCSSSWVGFSGLGLIRQEAAVHSLVCRWSIWFVAFVSSSFTGTLSVVFSFPFSEVPRLLELVLAKQEPALHSPLPCLLSSLFSSSMFVASVLFCAAAADWSLISFGEL